MMTADSKNMVLIGLRVPPEMADAIASLVVRGIVPSRQEYIRRVLGDALLGLSKSGIVDFGEESD